MGGRWAIVDIRHGWHRQSLPSTVCRYGFVLLQMVAALSAQAQDAPAVAKQIDARMDFKHPFKIGSDYYPQDSIKNREEGKCVVSGYVEVDGTILAAQIIKSTGYPRLDAACILALDVERAEPATVDGVARAGWSQFRLAWRLTPSTLSHGPALAEEFATPRFLSAPHVGGNYYPAEAIAKHQQGMCLVHAKVSVDGDPGPADLLKSTNSPSLDRACANAMVLARFSPEKHDGVAVDSAVVAAFFWRLK